MKRQTYIRTIHGLILPTDTPEAWPGAKRLPTAVAKRLLREESFAALRPLLPEGAEVWGIVLSVSQSGMSRKARFYVIAQGQPRNITADIGRVLDWQHDGGEWVRLNGCGMDMLWHTVECLGQALGVSLHSRRL